MSQGPPQQSRLIPRPKTNAGTDGDSSRRVPIPRWNLGPRPRFLARHIEGQS